MTHGGNRGHFLINYVYYAAAQAALYTKHPAALKLLGIHWIFLKKMFKMS